MRIDNSILHHSVLKGVRATDLYSDISTKTVDLHSILYTFAQAQHH